jgi:DNA-binding NtrC family response regulator
MSIATDTTTGGTLLPGGCGGNDAAGKRVLLLEDDPSLREAIRDFLSEWGHAVVEVEIGKDGNREVLAGDFAVVICDMMKPACWRSFFTAPWSCAPSAQRRFYFMTGHREATLCKEFIDAWSGGGKKKKYRL